MSWYRDSSGNIIVSEDNEINPRNNIQFQMGTRQLSDGSYLLLDESLLYLCGEKKQRRRFFGRRSSEEVTRMLPFEKAISHIIRDKDSLSSLCPRKHSVCRFYNDIFEVCSIAGKHDRMIEQNTPCKAKVSKAAPCHEL